MKSASRRRVLKGIASLTLAGGALAAPGVRAQPALKVTHAGLATGFSVIVNDMKAKRFDLQHGVDIDLSRTYVSVMNYYNDFAAGTFDLAIGSWDTFAQLYQRGMPVQLVCLSASADLMAIVTGPKGPDGIAGLKGKTMAALQNAGMYSITKLLVKDAYNLEMEKDITIQNVPSPAQAVTMVMGNAADAALSWEPNIATSMAQQPGMKVLMNIGSVYRERVKQELPYFAYATRREVTAKNPDLGKRVSAAFQACTEAIIANPDEAFTIAAPKMQVSKDVLLSAYKAGRLPLRATSASEGTGNAQIKAAFDYMQKRGAFEAKPLGADFFA
jgi:NitT/TauT family transport system substrate-binding protein